MTFSGVSRVSLPSSVGPRRGPGVWLHAGELVDDLYHVHGMRMARAWSATARVIDPPGCVGGDPGSPWSSRTFLGLAADEAEVAFLDEVEEEHAGGRYTGEGDNDVQAGRFWLACRREDDLEAGFWRSLSMSGFSASLVFWRRGLLDAWQGRLRCALEQETLLICLRSLTGSAVAPG